MHHKACLIIPYYGKWPQYLDLFFKGCERNQWLKVKFFTSLPAPISHPKNVEFIQLTLEELEAKVAIATGLTEYKLPFHYKLCDIRPIYGRIFKDHLKGFKYWAYGDCDLIFGDLHQFVGEKLEKGIDFISSRSIRITGSLFFIRNTEFNNNLYQRIHNYKNLILSEKFEGIDETCHNWTATERGTFSKSSFTYVIDDAYNNNEVTIAFQDMLNEDLKSKDLMTFKSGKLILNQKIELAYFHYVCNKGRPQFSYPSWKEIPDIFYITDAGFFKYKWEIFTLSLLLKYLRLSKYYLKKLPKYLSKKLN